MARKARTVALWSLSVLLSLMFLLSGSGKLLNGETSGGVRFDEQFELWGYPAWFRVPVGVAEVAGALFLLAPRARSFGAAGLTLLMAGAVVTHLRVGEAAFAPVPLALGVLAAAVAWMARPAWLQERLARRGRAQVA
jgi:putative oxidoreductase